MAALSTSSTAVLVTWDPVPEDHVNGILLGYYVFYQRVDKPQQEIKLLILNETSTSVWINNLEKFADYNFSVASFTEPGMGNLSDPVTNKTFEDGMLLHCCLSYASSDV